MKKIVILTAAAVIGLTGCTFVGTREKVQPIEQNVVDTSQSFYMIYPTNGVEQTYFTASITESTTSAKDASDVFYKKFYKKFGGLVISDKNISLTDGFKTANARGDKYLITMDINEWKDAFYMTCRPSTNPNGLTPMTTLDQAMDSADVTINVYDVKNQKLLNKQRIQNSGCPVVFLAVIPVGKNSPDSRFSSSLDKWAENLKAGTEQ